MSTTIFNLEAPTIPMIDESGSMAWAWRRYFEEVKKLATSLSSLDSSKANKASTTNEDTSGLSIICLLSDGTLVDSGVTLGDLAGGGSSGLSNIAFEVIDPELVAERTVLLDVYPISVDGKYYYATVSENINGEYFDTQQFLDHLYNQDMFALIAEKFTELVIALGGS